MEDREYRRRLREERASRREKPRLPAEEEQTPVPGELSHRERSRLPAREAAHRPQQGLSFREERRLRRAEGRVGPAEGPGEALPVTCEQVVHAHPPLPVFRPLEEAIAPPPPELPQPHLSPEEPAEEGSGAVSEPCEEPPASASAAEEIPPDPLREPPSQRDPPPASPPESVSPPSLAGVSGLLSWQTQPSLSSQRPATKPEAVSPPEAPLIPDRKAAAETPVSVSPAAPSPMEPGAVIPPKPQAPVVPPPERVVPEPTPAVAREAAPPVEAPKPIQAPEPVKPDVPSVEAASPEPVKGNVPPEPGSVEKAPPDSPPPQESNPAYAPPASDRVINFEELKSGAARRRKGPARMYTALGMAGLIPGTLLILLGSTPIRVLAVLGQLAVCLLILNDTLFPRWWSHEPELLTPMEKVRVYRALLRRPDLIRPTLSLMWRHFLGKGPRIDPSQIPGAQLRLYLYWLTVLLVPGVLLVLWLVLQVLVFGMGGFTMLIVFLIIFMRRKNRDDD